MERGSTRISGGGAETGWEAQSLTAPQHGPGARVCLVSYGFVCGWPVRECERV